MYWGKVLREDKEYDEWWMFLYVEALPFETGSQSGCVVQCLTGLHKQTEVLEVFYIASITTLLLAIWYTIIEGFY